MKISDYINALPDVYKKPNNRKLLELEQQLVQDFRNDVDALNDVLDIFKATGKTLDLYGKMYSQRRGALTDDQYRYAILQKAVRLFSGCDHKSIVTALASILGVPPTSFTIQDAEQNCVVEVKNLPFEVLQNAGITADQAVQMIDSMLAVGVRLADVNFEGSFEFGAPDEYDENKGFSNVEQTIGGYFGYLSNSNIVIPT